MKCSRRSTTCRPSRRILLAVLALAAEGVLAHPQGEALAWQAASKQAEAGPADQADIVRQAIESAVRDRIGREAQVFVANVRPRLKGRPAFSDLSATPAPGARLDRDIRFSLSSGGPAAVRAAGYAVAAVAASAKHLRGARLVRRGSLLAAADVELRDCRLGAVPLASLPSPEEAIGARAVRDIQPGEVITRSLLDRPPAVRSGDTVTLSAGSGGVVAAAQVTAVQNGSAGDVIRLVNQASRKTLRGRVVGPGTVEVVR